MKPGYWLIAYVVRMPDSKDWVPANMVWYGTPGGALTHLVRLNESYKCDQVVTSAMPISKADYNWIKENL